MIRLQEKLGFRMISFSSAEVYGDYEGIMTEDVMENRPIKDTYQMNDYAISKWAGELMCMNSATFQMGWRIDVHELCNHVWN